MDINNQKEIAIEIIGHLIDAAKCLKLDYKDPQTLIFIHHIMSEYGIVEEGCGAECDCTQGSISVREE